MPVRRARSFDAAHDSAARGVAASIRSLDRRTIGRAYPARDESVNKIVNELAASVSPLA
jgi:hypothetical protein